MTTSRHSATPTSGPKTPIQSADFRWGSIRICRGRRKFRFEIKIRDTITVTTTYTLAEARRRFDEVARNGGPSMVEYAWMAAHGDLLPACSIAEVDALCVKYEAAARALTSAQREIATALYFDADMTYLEAIEAARLMAPQP